MPANARQSQTSSASSRRKMAVFPITAYHRLSPAIIGLPEACLAKRFDRCKPPRTNLNVSSRARQPRLLLCLAIPADFGAQRAPVRCHGRRRDNRSIWIRMAKSRGNPQENEKTPRDSRRSNLTRTGTCSLKNSQLPRSSIIRTHPRFLARESTWSDVKIHQRRSMPQQQPAS